MSLGATNGTGLPESGPRRPRLWALLEFRDEKRYLAGWLAAVAPEVDGILALDDASSDGSAELLIGHPLLVALERSAPREGVVRDGAANRRALYALAERHGADWLVAIDADERPEIGFGERARAEIVRLESQGLSAASVRIRELWSRPDLYRTDGRWGEKRHARLFRSRAGAEIDPRPLHGHWAPLDARIGGAFAPADLDLYHLRMIRREDREARRRRHEQHDPDRRHQAIGYAHLTDESGIELIRVPAERDYRREPGDRPGLTILITNFALARPTGTEAFVVDLARGLLRRGHWPRVYSPRTGALAEQLRAAGVPVVDDLEKLDERPDVLHLQHHLEAVTALARFPGVPAIFACHGFRPWQETPVRHPAIATWIAVDETTRERLEIEHGVPPARVRRIPNFVDTDRFRPRSSLPRRPLRALVLNNELTEETGIAEIRRACNEREIELEAAGVAIGRPFPDPEREMSRFDIVFGHGRVALEAMATGAAAVVCGAEGLGPLVSPENFDELRALNFGFRAQRSPITAAAVARILAGFDALRAAQVTARVREEASLEKALDLWIAAYEEARTAVSPDAGSEDAHRALAGYLRWLGQEVEGNLLAVENRAAAIRRDEERLSRLREQVDAERAERSLVESRLVDVEGRLTESERFRTALLASRSWKLVERIRGLAGRRWIATPAARVGKPRLLALLVFRDEMEFLPGWFENVAPEVDGVVALDDGSIDGSAELVARHPSVLELVRLPRRAASDWDDGANHRRVVEAALAHAPDWMLGVDADERLETGFGERARRLVTDAGGDGPGAYYVVIRELWDHPDRFRADGVWGAKRSARLFRARRDHEFDPRRLHGVWAPLNARVNGDYPLADLIVYHLRMLTPERRRLRRERYEALDPQAAFQRIGYAYLTDETGIELSELPPGRGYRPLGR